MTHTAKPGTDPILDDVPVSVTRDKPDVDGSTRERFEEALGLLNDEYQDDQDTWRQELADNPELAARTWRRPGDPPLPGRENRIPVRSDFLP